MSTKREREDGITIIKDGASCPDCGNTLQSSCGCSICTDCGYSPCG